MNEKQSLIASNEKCYLQKYHSKELSLIFKLDVSKLSKNFWRTYKTRFVLEY